MTKFLLLAAGLVAYLFLRRKNTAQAKPAVATNADAAYASYGNRAPQTVLGSVNASPSGIGTSDYGSIDVPGSPYVYKVTSGYVHPSKPMVDDVNSAAGVETLQWVDPFHDESSN